MPAPMIAMFLFVTVPLVQNCPARAGGHPVNSALVRKNSSRRLLDHPLTRMMAAGVRMIVNRTRKLAMLIATAFVTGTFPASAQSYPSKPIKLIVPFGAGGPVDVMGRLVAQKLTASVGAMIVENRPGQGGTLGSRAVAIAEPDGYTLMVATSTTMGVSANLYKNLDFDPVKSFSPIALISSVPFVLVVRPSLPIKTVPEFIAYAKANPGKLNFGFPTGTLPHLTGELFKL